MLIFLVLVAGIIRGVKVTNSSLSCLSPEPPPVELVLWTKNFPRTGTFDSQGNFSKSSSLLLAIKPPIDKVAPSFKERNVDYLQYGEYSVNKKTFKPL